MVCKGSREDEKGQASSCYQPGEAQAPRPRGEGTQGDRGDPSSPGARSCGSVSLFCWTLTLTQALPGPGPGLRRTALPGGSETRVRPNAAPRRFLAGNGPYP